MPPGQRPICPGAIALVICDVLVTEIGRYKATVLFDQDGHSVAF